MIYTVTLNPAVDYAVYIGSLEPGATNRSRREQIDFGGKGINVSRVLAQLGVESTALGFIAGFTGDALERAVRESGVKTDFIRLDTGYTRINIKLKGSCETEINAAGPKVPPQKLALLSMKLDRLTADDLLVLSGSVPSGLPQDIYETVLARPALRSVRFAVDAAGELLLRTLPHRPFLIKPNRRELEELCGHACGTDAEVLSAARELQTRGAQNVLVSLGADGALLLDPTGTVHRCPALGGKPVNTVGAGDSMVAGFLAGLKDGYDRALLLGSAAAGATACSEGLADSKTVTELLKCADR